MKRTYVAIVLDKSGSMATIRHEAIAAFNGMLATIQASAAEGGETKLALVVFNGRARVEVQPDLPSRLRSIDVTHYSPTGGTALFDAVDTAVRCLQDLPYGGDPDTSFLVVTITDGEENQSLMSTRSFVTLIDRLQETERWSFAFNVPHGARRTAIQYGIPADNVREWEQTSVGAREMAEQNNAGLTNYFAGRASGRTATKAFYAPVTTSLANVNAKTVATKLADVSGHFKIFEVKSEADVKSFVETKTKKPYVVGQAYYLLMKSEKVQPTKAVLLMEKDKPSVFGGQAARELIGLPSDQPAKVTPGNHANYDVYVQSTSSNRKLPRGTRVLVDVAQTQSMAPTWTA